jgi:hypothetical protein
MYWEDGTMYRATRVTYPEKLPKGAMVAGDNKHLLTSGWVCCCRDCQKAIRKHYQNGEVVWADYLPQKVWEKRMKLKRVNQALDGK